MRLHGFQPNPTVHRNKKQQVRTSILPSSLELRCFEFVNDGMLSFLFDSSNLHPASGIFNMRHCAVDVFGAVCDDSICFY